MCALKIHYESEDFPSGLLASGVAELSVSWDDILWAAMTVGRPNRHYVFMHGDASVYEAIFRLSLVRMALEQSGTRAHRLRRTRAAATLDPTEKGAVNYFLGMTFCKLFAAKLLNTPWLLHLDVFGHELGTVLTERSRPDLVGLEHGSTQWHAFECKGRSSNPGLIVKDKAKAQAQRLTSVGGTVCSLHIGAITFFNKDILNFYWRDPIPEKKGIEIPKVKDIFKYNYLSTAQIIQNIDQQQAMAEKSYTFAAIEGTDVEVSLHPAVARYVFRQEWEKVQPAAVEAKNEIARDGYQPDGVSIKAGSSWNRPFESAENILR